MATSKAGRLVELFGGVRKMSEATGLDKATISRWDSSGKRGKHGRVPTEYNNVIVDAAGRLNLNGAAVLSCLDPHICPSCQRPLEPGQAPAKH